MKTGQKPTPTQAGLPYLGEYNTPAERVTNFFRYHLIHVKGELAGQPLVLAEWQVKDIVKPLFDTRTSDGMRTIRTCYVEVPRKNAKAVHVATPIPTPDGWTTMGAIQEGDTVFDERGAPVRVISASDVMHDHECYRVSFSDGTSIIADAKHEWRTRTQNNGTRAKAGLTVGGLTQSLAAWSRASGIPEKTIWQRVRRLGWQAEDAVSRSVASRSSLRRRWRHAYGRGPQSLAILGSAGDVWTTEQIRDSLGTERASNARRGIVQRNHCIEGPTALALPERSLPIDAYVLGAWLGDGTSAAALVTCGDQDVDHFTQEFQRAGIVLTRRRHRAAWVLWLRDMQRHLRALGVLGTKHIPAGYLRAAPAQRMALLQGLMDTDGTCSKAGQCSYATSNAELRDGALELVRSLGFKATCREQRARLYGRDYGPTWRVEFFAFDDRPVFRLARKRVRQKSRKTSGAREDRQIVAVDPVASVPVRCITVDSPSHLYLAGEGMIPTHNSTLGAGLALYLLYADEEPGAEIVSAAADREQAAIVFDIAKSMVEASPKLSARARIYRREIVVPSKTGESVYKVISSEAYSKHGFNLHAAIIDEVHAHQDGGELYGVLTKGMGSRRQPVTFAITTAGHDRKETSLCWQLHQRALRVKAGLTQDPSFLGVVYAAPQDADWTDRKVWAMANPGLGVTVKEAFLEQECRRALDMPTYENEFRQYHLDQWTESVKAWLQMSKWDKCATPVSREALKGRRCFGGLDMATNTDLAALVLVFPDEGGGFDVLAHAWCPEVGIKQRSQRDHAPYDVWVRQGQLESTEGDAVDQVAIRERILEYAAEFDIAELGFDDWNMGYLGPKLLADGLNLKPIRQTFKALSGATKHLERLVLKKAIRHGGHPVLRWCIANTVVMKDGPENVKPSKEKSPERIDLTVALVMALECAGTDEGPSVYASRGVVAL